MGESAEMYLETILVLQRKSDEGVHAIDVSRAMGFSKPSVSVALKRLKNQGFIDIDGFDHIILLPKGRELAEEIYERHEILTDVFVELGVPYEIAAEDACRIEHVVSKETFAALKKRRELIKKTRKRSSKAKKN
ncbi:metal-dependent transcriptional regulator [bacterium]|nr:metal-dependent transcriptional regulator [bacterium]